MLNGMVKNMSKLNFKEYTDPQCMTMLELIVNLSWDLIREAVDVWSDLSKNNKELFFSYINNLWFARYNNLFT